MRILVTGGTGFLGSHLCSALLQTGAEVVALSRNASRVNDFPRGLIENPKFELVQQDITLPFKVTADAIYNLASPASPAQHQQDPLQSLKTNILGTINVLDLANELRVPVFQASTGEVYGDPSISPQPEEYWGNVNPIGPRACYTEAKRVAETLSFEYHKQFGFPVRIARLFSFYGPGMSPSNGRAISTFIVQALRGEPITIFGDGSQTRSFCFVGDMVSGIMAMMHKKEGIVGPLNLGSPHGVSMLQLADMVITKTKSKSQIVFLPKAHDDPRQLIPSISRAHEELDWKPVTSLSEGLDQTIEHFRRSHKPWLP